MSQDLELKVIPQHVAIIMDGNGRWAQSRGLLRIEGHRRGAQALRATVKAAAEFGVRYLTVFAFSTENWNRPQIEVAALMKMLRFHLSSTSKEMIENDVRMRFIGDRKRLPSSVLALIEKVEEASAKCSRLELIIALSYGGRAEIVASAASIARDVLAGKITLEQIDEAIFSKYLYLPDVPDPDLLIRTSGECRISNFLLWQLAYAEIVIRDLYWPDFNKDEFFACLKQFAQRHRRYGLTEEQVSLE